MLPKEHPKFIFRIDTKPELTDNLNNVDVSSTELFVQGKTKNIEKLASF